MRESEWGQGMWKGSEKETGGHSKRELVHMGQCLVSCIGIGARGRRSCIYIQWAVQLVLWIRIDNIG